MAKLAVKSSLPRPTGVLPEMRPRTTRADSQAAAGELIDRFGRRITYLRLSVTDRCDLRCSYCMPHKVKFLPKHDVLTLEECLRVVSAFTAVGVRKLRITGGEPLVRRGIVNFAARAAALSGLAEVTMTTNGSQLARFAEPLQVAGVARLNISLDTLRAERFRKLTYTGKIDKTLAGLDAACAAGFAGIKLNTVLMRGVNDDELCDLVSFAIDRGIDISFIEEMPLGDIGRMRTDTYFSSDEALAVLRRKFNLRASDYDSGGPAKYWQVVETATRVGFISPHSHNFCAACNRVRVNCIGQLFPCLGQNDMVDLRPALRDGMDDTRLTTKIMHAMDIKPKGHDFDLKQPNVKIMRFMSATGG